MSVAVRILSAQGDIPLMVDGIITGRDNDQFEVHCSSGADGLTKGDKIVLTIEGESGNLRCLIASKANATQGGFALSVISQARHEADKRDFPRLHAGLPIRYRGCTDTEAAKWIEGEPVGGEWIEPDPYMNFSVGGLRFDCVSDLAPESLLIIELRVGDTGPLWRVTGRVIRVFTATEHAGPSVAVSFEHLPSDALEALTELTLQIQESLL